MGDQEDAARKEEARLLKTMARRTPAAAKGFGKTPSMGTGLGSASSASSGGVGEVKSRAGASLGRSSSYAPAGTTAVSTSDSSLGSGASTSVAPSDGVAVQKSAYGASKGELSAAPASGLQKSPSFGSSRNIVPRTTSLGPASSSSNLKAPVSVDEEAIKRREAEFEAERARLLQVEQSLIKNTKNALSDMGEINSEADRHERARLERQKSEIEKAKVSSAPKPSQPAAVAPQVAPVSKASAPAPSSGETWSVNKALIDDVDSLLAQLNQAATQVYTSASKTQAAKENPLFEKAKSILRSRKATIPTFVSTALGAALPVDLDSALASYIRDITASMKPVQELSSKIPLTESTFDYMTMAETLDVMLLKIVTDIHLLLDHNSREMVSNYSMELVDKAIMLMQDIHEQSPLIQNPSLASPTGPLPDDIILSSQNKFILFLKHLAQSITTAAKKQIEEMQAKRDKNSALAQCVQDTAAHAQALAQILKQPLFEPQAFKDKLASLVTTIKRAAPLLTPGPQHDSVMDGTRKVLEASLKLQEAHQSGSPLPASSTTDASSPHIQVFHAIGDLLRAVLATIQTNQ
jgi:hypothetical protein